MAKMQLDLPSRFMFQTNIRIRIDDLNYGGHLSNDAYLKYMHESRVQFFNHLGLSEMNIGGCSVILGESTIVFQQECFYGENLLIELAVTNLGNKSFDFFYRFTKQENQSAVCEARTAMVCFNYETRGSVPIPDTFRNAIRKLAE
jgi:YbgC/YbaW family acyl-CoA thioester hydrolase